MIKWDSLRTKFVFSALFVCLIQLSGVNTLLAQNYSEYIFEQSDEEKMNRWVDSVYLSLSTKDLLAQLIMPVVYPSANAQELAEQVKSIKTNKWGGILYQKGLLAEQLEMNTHLQQASSTPMLIALDGEWGLYMRLKDAPRYPRNYGLGKCQDNQMLYNYGREVARQCRLMGIHINFAPVLDVNINPANPVIGTRSFGENPDLVAECSLAYAQGLEDGGILSCAKHFPGHGDTAQDSHKTLPRLSASKERMEKIELKPFKSYIKQGLGGIMTAHLNIPAYEPENIPSSLSYNICTDLLQDELGFKGLVFTDGLEMQGVLKSGIKHIGIQAILAGNDILLGPHDPKAMLDELILGYEQALLPKELVEAKVRKILAYKWRLIISKKDKRATKKQIYSAIWTDEALKFKNELWDKSLYFVKNKKVFWSSIKKNAQKTIAVVNLGKRYAQPSHLPSHTKGGAKIKYFNWTKIDYKKSKVLEQYQHIVINIFKKNLLSISRINHLARTRHLLLAYYYSPFAINERSLELTSADIVLLASEGTQDAQDAVLRLYAKEERVQKNKPTIQTEQKEDDPTTAIYQRKTANTPKSVSQNGIAILDSLVNDGLHQGAYPSCQLYISENGLVKHNKAYGSRTNDKVSTTTDLNSIYDLASVTKAIATTPALMLLVGQNKVNLNKRLSYYLPRFKGTEVGNVRLTELLYHEAGLPSGLLFYKSLFERDRAVVYFPDNALKPSHKEESIFYSKYIALQKTAYCSKPFARGIYISPQFKEIMLDKIANLKLKRRGHYRYSDLSFILLQQVIERVSMQTLDTFVEENIFKPIGAKLYFNPLEQDIPLWNIIPAQNDTILRKQVIHGTVDDETAACLGGVSGNAGLFGSATELAKVCQLILNDGRWGKKQIIPKWVVKKFCETKSRNSLRAMGFDAPRTKVGNTAKAMSPNSIGHLGFTGTAFWIDRDNKIIYIFLSNRTYPNRSNRLLQRENYRPRLLQLYYDERQKEL